MGFGFGLIIASFSGCHTQTLKPTRCWEHKMTDDGVIVNLKSIAARERKNGNHELAGIIETAVADQQEIMRINNQLRGTILQIRAVAMDNHSSDNNSTAMALRFIEDLIVRVVQ
jgi:hypothetical protein